MTHTVFLMSLTLVHILIPCRTRYKFREEGSVPSFYSETFTLPKNVLSYEGPFLSSISSVIVIISSVGNPKCFKHVRNASFMPSGLTPQYSYNFFFTYFNLRSKKFRTTDRTENDDCLRLFYILLHFGLHLDVPNFPINYLQEDFTPSHYIKHWDGL